MYTWGTLVCVHRPIGNLDAEFCEQFLDSLVLRVNLAVVLLITLLVTAPDQVADGLAVSLAGRGEIRKADGRAVVQDCARHIVGLSPISGVMFSLERTRLEEVFPVVIPNEHEIEVVAEAVEVEVWMHWRTLTAVMCLRQIAVKLDPFSKPFRKIGDGRVVDDLVGLAVTQGRSRPDNVLVHGLQVEHLCAASIAKFAADIGLPEVIMRQLLAA